MRGETGKLFRAVCYGTNTLPNAQPAAENPVDEPATIEYDGMETEVPWNVDLDGLTVANVLGEPFEPVPTRPEYDRIMVVTSNVVNYDDGQVASFRGYINSTAFCGHPEKTVKCTKVRALIEDGAAYTRVSVTFEIRNTGWEYEQFVHQGYREKNANGEIVTAKTTAGEPMNRPVLLAADGTRLGEGLPAVLLSRRKFNAISFDELAQILDVPGSAG
jgi:hypothetical protein